MNERQANPTHSDYQNILKDTLANLNPHCIFAKAFPVPNIGHFMDVLGLTLRTENATSEPIEYNEDCLNNYEKEDVTVSVDYKKDPTIRGAILHTGFSVGLSIRCNSPYYELPSESGEGRPFARNIRWNFLHPGYSLNTVIRPQHLLGVIFDPYKLNFGEEQELYNNGNMDYRDYYYIESRTDSVNGVVRITRRFNNGEIQKSLLYPSFQHPVLTRNGFPNGLPLYVDSNIKEISDL